MKKWIYILISSSLIFILNFPAHFLFEFLPFNFIGYFFPVNESIFQHMKMLFTCVIIFYLILRIFKNKLGFLNLCTAALVSALGSIGSFLAVYLPVYFLLGENMIFTFILLFLAILFGQYIASFILLKKDYKYLNYISLFIILIILILNASLTYNPLNNFFFLDKMHKTYGVVYKR